MSAQLHKSQGRALCFPLHVWFSFYNPGRVSRKKLYRHNWFQFGFVFFSLHGGCINNWNTFSVLRVCDKRNYYFWWNRLGKWIEFTSGIFRCSNVLFTFDTDFKVWERQASCDVCMPIRVLTGDLVVHQFWPNCWLCLMVESISEWKKFLFTCLSQFTVSCLMDLKYLLASNRQGGRKKVVMDLFPLLGSSGSIFSADVQDWNVNFSFWWHLNFSPTP